MIKKYIDKFFLNKKKNTNSIEKKRSRDRHILFKGGQPTQVSIGEHSYVNGMTIYSWGTDSQVVIGKFCSIADNVTLIAGGEHTQNWVSTFPFQNRWQLPTAAQTSPNSSKGAILIGHDVWIGHGVTILSGVTIGNGAIIGAGSVVAKSVPDYAVVVGNPAQVVKYRFNSQQIESFLSISWWDWPEDQIVFAQPFFADPNIFISKFHPLNVVAK